MEALLVEHAHCTGNALQGGRIVRPYGRRGKAHIRPVHQPPGPVHIQALRHVLVQPELLLLVARQALLGLIEVRHGQPVNDLLLQARLCRRLEEVQGSQVQLDGQVEVEEESGGGVGVVKTVREGAEEGWPGRGPDKGGGARRGLQEHSHSLGENRETMKILQNFETARCAQFLLFFANANVPQ